MKKRFLFAALLILLVSVLPTTAYALEVPDFDRQGSIAITMTCQGEAVPGGSLTLYRVADVHAENGADYSFRYTQEYTACGVALNLNSAETAEKLVAFTAEKKITGTKLQIDKKGEVTFQKLNIGLYLLVQEDAADGYEKVSPFLVSVPGREAGRYIYDVDASPKLELEKAPTQPTTPPTTKPEKPPKLPQTGLVQWPVPILAVSGIACLIVGWYFQTSGKKKDNES